jgi:hypothetical protein
MFLLGKMCTFCCVLVDFYQTTWRHIPGDCQRYENLSVRLSDTVRMTENWLGSGFSWTRYWINWCARCSVAVNVRLLVFRHVTPYVWVYICRHFRVICNFHHHLNLTYIPVVWPWGLSRANLLVNSLHLVHRTRMNDNSRHTDMLDIRFRSENHMKINQVTDTYLQYHVYNFWCESDRNRNINIRQIPKAIMQVLLW